MLQTTTIVFFAMALLWSCRGTKTSNASSQEQPPVKRAVVGEVGSFAVRTEAELPECNDSNENRVFYVRGVKGLYSCQFDNSTGSYGNSRISIVGSKGPKGDTGDKGPQGDKGETGDAGAQGAKGEVGDKGPQGD